MSLGKNSRIKNIRKITDALKKGPVYNTSSPNNPSHIVDQNTNFVLRPITLETIDEAVFRTFDKRWQIRNKNLDLILLDAEVASLKFQHPENFNKIKEYLNLPYFVGWRAGSGKLLYRTSPSKKSIIYTIPTMKPQGLVYEEYIMPSPQLLKFPYTLKFLSTYRQSLNEFEVYMTNQFKNKLNQIEVDKERFIISPVDTKDAGKLDVNKRESNGRTLYTLTYDLEITGYLRDISQVQKREKPNTFNIQISERTESVNGNLIITNIST